MKVKLLKKLRKKTLIYFSYKRDKVDTETRKDISGRFVVKNSILNISYYCDTLEDVIHRRRLIILDLLYSYREKFNYIEKEVLLTNYNKKP
jgi:hypothetical protein|tara:strand:- start:2932 stop:3204 length:273 start_codon:yes stop_codon:yes gene_type:complete